ncbi:hypothetical protein [Allomuricauda sp. M10]|uniref:hypothetical protein n=1 Tax=Allomuricauda sp. M10 TaxID=2683292 RepID=UPI001D19874C|nr:hypothetical protein [Muricauda sp. M10]
MEVKCFKNLVNENCIKLNLEKFKTSYFKDSKDSITFLILRKSGYSTKYYLRVKTVLKPLENSFDKSEFIKHDISDILLSLDSENPEIFDLENNISDNIRTEKINAFFQNNVNRWLKILENKETVKSEFTKNGFFYYPIRNKNLK